MPKVIDLMVILYIACLSIFAMVEATTSVTSVVVNDDKGSVTTTEDNIGLIGLNSSSSSSGSNNSSSMQNGQRKYLHSNANNTTINIRRTAAQLTDDDNVRCFCNLPVCASTNYMCMTNNKTGGCFSEIHQSAAESGLPKRHGCVDFLKKSKSDLVCDNVPRKHTLAPPFGDILVLCCQENLCNYLHYEANQKLAPSRDSNGSASKQSNNDLWFKVAIIIVPILGIIIVVLLIILAIKMLKSDGLDSTFKPSIDNLGPQFKGSMYGFKAVNVEDGVDPDTNMALLNRATSSSNCDKKNENLAKRNELLSIEYRLLPISYQDPNIKLLNTEDGVINNVYSKNFNLAQNKTVLKQITNNVKDDKVYDKEFLNPVVVNWTTHYKENNN